MNYYYHHGRKFLGFLSYELYDDTYAFGAYDTSCLDPVQPEEGTAEHKIRYEVPVEYTFSDFELDYFAAADQQYREALEKVDESLDKSTPFDEAILQEAELD